MKPLIEKIMLNALGKCYVELYIVESGVID